MAEIAADDLSWQGLKIAGTGPAGGVDHAKTRIIVHNEKSAALEALVSRLGVKQSQIEYVLDGSAAADFEVILGEDYDPCR
jgi:hypothetical protein